MNYELMLVVNSTGDVDPAISRVEKSLKDANATAIKISKLGKKNLAYPIAKQNEGEYVLLNFEAGGEVVGVINKKLRLEQEAVLRYLIIKAKPSTVSKITEIKDAGEKPKELSKVTVKTVSSKEKKVEEKKVEESLPSKDRKAKVTKEKGTKGTTAKGESRPKERKGTKGKKKG